MISPPSWRPRRFNGWRPPEPLDLGDDRLALGHEAPGPLLAAEGQDANAERPRPPPTGGERARGAVAVALAPAPPRPSRDTPPEGRGSPGSVARGVARVEVVHGRRWRGTAGG